MQYLAVLATHRDPVDGTLECLDWRGRKEEGHRFLVLLRIFICAGNGGVSQVHQQQVALLGHHVLAHRLLVRRALRESELLARHLLLLLARGNIPEARRAVMAGGDDGASLAELDLRDRTAERCTNVSVRKCPPTTGLLQLQYVVVFYSVLQCVATKNVRI